MADFHSNSVKCFQYNEHFYLKKAKLEDQDFLFQVFIECRPDLQWICNTDVQQMVIRQQYEIEHTQTNLIYPDAIHNIIMLNDIRVGRLIINKKEKTVRIIEIGLIESYRNKGIGSTLIDRIKKEALEKGEHILLQVAWFNHSAYQFYKKHEFVVKENLEYAYEMVFNEN